jgi:hypothetical protein
LGKLVSPKICVGQFNRQNYIGTRCKPNSLSPDASSAPCRCHLGLLDADGAPPSPPAHLQWPACRHTRRVVDDFPGAGGQLRSTCVLCRSFQSQPATPGTPPPPSPSWLAAQRQPRHTTTRRMQVQLVNWRMLLARYSVMFLFAWV